MKSKFFPSFRQNLLISGIDLRGVTQGWVTFRFLTLKMGHFSKKRHFFTKKGQNIQCLSSKFFRGAFGAAKYPHIPIFLRFIAFLFNKFFEKEKIFCLYPFLPKFFFYWNNIRFHFVHLPWYSQIFGEGGGSIIFPGREKTETKNTP